MEIKNEVLYDIWKDRYSKNGETITENIHRVSKYIAKNSIEEAGFFGMMDNGWFFPAGRTMSNSGIGKNLTLNNCFTLNFVEDSLEDIFEKVKIGAITHSKGGGTGYEFSKIRPNGTATSNDAVASGVVSFMDVFNAQTATILQGGRRGANMGILSIYHPDIFSYLDAKSYDEGRLVHFNLSIMVDDAFMKAKQANEKITLHFPVYNEIGKMITDPAEWTHSEEVDANELWDMIMQKAYTTGEYGVFFYENLNRDNNTWYMETLINTNPCGEYLSGLLFGLNPLTGLPIDGDIYKGACNLGSMFLHNFVTDPFTKDVKLDYTKLSEAIKLGVRFLDNVIDINIFPHAHYENYQKAMRTIGIGITGLADVLAMHGLKYGSPEAVKFTDNLMNFIAKECYRASIELAKEKGSFPFLDREKFVQSGFILKHILKDSEWEQIANDILNFGIRNARIISIAPTGTLSLTFGNNCSSGLEPIFSLSYDRKVKMGGQDEKDIKIVKMEDYAYCLYRELKNGKDAHRIIVEEDTFTTAMNLSVEAHLEMLKVIAFHTDMSCSKTVNIPTDYSFERMKLVYDFCWENGIKGCTVFRPNPIRQGILISTEAKEALEKELENTPTELKRGDWKQKAEDTAYVIRKIYIGCGKLNLFIGWSASEKSIQDMYVIRTGHGGCEKNIQATVIAMSGMLRLGGNIFNIEKAFDGMGACNSFVGQRAKGVQLSKGGSCSIAILNEIKAYLKEMDVEETETEPTVKVKVKAKVEAQLVLTDTEKAYIKKNGDIAFGKEFHKCPSCADKLEYNGGCLSCASCGWTKCE